MRRRILKPSELDKLKGWTPVWFGIGNDEGDPVPRVAIDLCAPWRLPDNKVLFVEIWCSTKAEMDDVLAFIRKGVNEWAEKLNQDPEILQEIGWTSTSWSPA